MFWAKHDRKPFPLELRFEPASDITVYELAYILSKTMRQPVSFEYGEWPKIPPEIQRHFK